MKYTLEILLSCVVISCQAMVKNPKTCMESCLTHLTQDLAGKDPDYNSFWQQLQHHSLPQDIHDAIVTHALSPHSFKTARSQALLDTAPDEIKGHVAQVLMTYIHIGGIITDPREYQLIASLVLQAEELVPARYITQMDERAQWTTICSLIDRGPYDQKALDTLKSLLKKGINPNAGERYNRNHEYELPIVHATKLGNKPAAKLLLKNGSVIIPQKERGHIVRSRSLETFNRQ